MLVNAGLVGKSIGPYDGLIWGNGLPDDARQLTGSAEKLARIDLSIGVIAITAGFERHDDFFQGCVARPLANAIYRAFHLRCSCAHGCQGIGHAQPQVVMAVHGKNCLFHALGMGEGHSASAPAFRRASRNPQYLEY